MNRSKKWCCIQIQFTYFTWAFVMLTGNVLFLAVPVCLSVCVYVSLSLAAKKLKHWWSGTDVTCVIVKPQSDFDGIWLWRLTTRTVLVFFNKKVTCNLKTDCWLACAATLRGSVSKFVSMSSVKLLGMFDLDFLLLMLRGNAHICAARVYSLVAICYRFLLLLVSLPNSIGVRSRWNTSFSCITEQFLSTVWRVNHWSLSNFVFVNTSV